MKKEAHWIVCVGDFSHWECKRCGEKVNVNEIVQFPVPLWVMPALLKGFNEKHEHCKEGES